jgi:FtsH-binding integral membrane protein
MAPHPSGAAEPFALDSRQAFGFVSPDAKARLRPGQPRGISMSDFDRNLATVRPGYRTDQVAIDAGLRAYMIRVYNYMASGVALTGVVAWLTYQAAGGDAIQIAGGQITGLTAFGQAIFSGPLTIVLLLGTLGLVFFMSYRISRLSVGTAMSLFFIYAGLLGLALASVFLQYTGASITRVFFISAATFGATSLYGYTTQRDLTGVGSFMFMGLIGIIIASLVNMFLKSSGLDWAISVIGVLIFVGLTAYDTQRIKEMYSVQDDGTVTGRKAVMGALSLYLDFINLFLMLLRIFGDRR